MRLSLLQLAAIALAAVGVGAPVALAQAAVQNATVSPLLATATDLGALPVSQPVTGVVLQLATTPAQQADLAQFLSAVVDSSSAEHHQWLTPSAFADRFGASAADVATLTAWLGGQGLHVDFVAQARDFVVVSGTAAQVESALDVQLDRFLLANGTRGFANIADPVLPADIAALIANVRGLNDFAYAPAAAASKDPLLAAALGIDGNANPVMRVHGGCAASLTVADMAWFESVAMQANAQGITLLASTHDCGTGAAFPAILTEVTAVGKVSAPVADPGAYPVVRPAWQSVAGVPVDGMRHTPDLSTSGDASDTASFAAVLGMVLQKAKGVRQGNVNSILYTIAGDPGVFTPAASSADGLTPMARTTGTDTANYDPLGGLGVPEPTPMLDYWPLGSVASNTSLVSSNYSPQHGQSFTLTATVTPTGVTGSVNFFTGGTTFLGTANLVSGTATFSTSSLAGGTYAITATYSGDGTYASSTSGQATVTVLPEAASITASVNGTPTIGTPFTVDVSVAGTSGVGAPTGTIKVTPQGVSNSTTGNATLSPGTAANTSTATPSVMIGQAGTFTLTTSCVSGDQSFTCSTPASTQVTIAAGTTTTALSFTPNPPTPGQPITLTATVTPSVSGANIIAPTGTVNFFDGTTNIGSGALTSGTATATATLSPGKTHSLTAKYAGDTNFATSTSTAQSAAGGMIASVTGLSSSTFTSTYGANVTFTAVVTADPSVTTALSPTGKVNFFDNGTLLGSSTLASGVANFSTTALPVGLQSITATYVGDTNFATSTSTAFNGVTVSAATGTLTASISPATGAPYGSIAVLTATLTLANGGTPTGTITATIPGTGGGTYMGTLVANTGGSATATINVNVPPPGNYTITVACVSTGTANFTCPSTTTTLAAVKGLTTTTVSFTPTAPFAGQSTVLNAVIANAGAGTGSYTFTGSVTFYDNGAAIGTAAVAGNSASTTVTFKANTVHSIVAIYSGDTNWTTSTSAAAPLSPIASPTTTTLGSNYTTALSGTNLILTATVGSVNGASGIVTSIPTGTVTFYDNFNGVIATLGTAVLSADGPYMSMATFTTTGLQGGAHSIFSIYNGDTNYSSSTSETLVITEQDYSLVFNPATLTLNRGQSGQVAVILGTVGGFSGTISFGCTPPPDTETTCSFLPATVSNGGSTTLFIGTTAPNAKQATETAGNLVPVLIPFTAAGLLLLLPGRRKRLGIHLGAGLMVLLLAAGLANLGCSTVTVNPNGTTGTGTGGTSTGTPQGSNTFTITTAGTSVGSNGTYTVRHTTSYLVTTQ